MEEHINDVEQFREGPVARTIESETAKVPSDAFLWAAGGAVGLSWLLRLAGRKSASEFVATWVPSILICGVYNKIVKTHGHDASSNSQVPDSKSRRGKRHTTSDDGKLSGGLGGRLSERAGQSVGTETDNS